MPRNRSLSTESALAKNEAGIRSHCLDSRGKSMEGVNKERDFFEVRKKIGLEYFRKIGIGLRIFCPGIAKKKGNSD